MSSPIKKVQIAIGADHAGFELKQKIIAFLEEKKYDVVDKGANAYDENDDYPDFCAPVGRMVSAHSDEVKGIVIGGSGQGEAIVCNRFPDVRAIVFNGQYAPKDERVVPEEIKLSREHNDANVLALGARFLSEEEAMTAVTQWLDTPFSGEDRHMRRIKKIDSVTRKAKEGSEARSFPMMVVTGIIASVAGSIILKLIGVI